MTHGAVVTVVNAGGLAGRCSLCVADTAREAIAHVLRRTKTDADFRYHMLATESLDKLCAAYDAIAERAKGATMAEVLDAGPGARSRCAGYKSQAWDLERLLDDHPELCVEVPCRREVDVEVECALPFRHDGACSAAESSSQSSEGG